MVLATCLVTLSVVCQREPCPRERPPTRNTGPRTLVFCRGPSDGNKWDRKPVLTERKNIPSLRIQAPNYSQARSQSSFIQLATHFTVVDIWSEFDTEDYANP